VIVDSPLSLDYPELPAGAVLAGAAARWGDRVALHVDGPDGPLELTFAQLYGRACQFAHGLRAEGIGRGDVVAVHLANCPEFAVAYHGILLAGATFTPANPLLPPKDLAAQLADSGAVLAISFHPASRVLTAVQEHTAIRRVLLVGEAGDRPEAGFEAFLAAQPTTRPETDLDPRTDLAHLAYTGGTTGRSKGVALPHRNVLVNALQYACWGSGSVPRTDGGVDGQAGVYLEQTAPAGEFPVRLGTGTAINLTPWFHAMGTVGSLNVALLLGTTQVLHQRFEPGRYLADAERFRVTSMAGAPPLFAALVRHPDFATRDLSSVRGITSGAAPLAVELINALRGRLGEGVVVGEGYGLTEVTMGATAGPAGLSAVRKVGTVGLPVADTQVKLVGEGSPEGSDGLPPGEPGEVCIRGPQVMLGYRNRPEETAETLVDGWLRTGDIGVLDADGYLAIVDRKKDMLLYKGYNVYPRELEERLFAQPGVTGAAVVGRVDAEVGELPVAFVVAAGLDADGGEELREKVNAELLPYQRLRELHLVEEIPVSAAGKVLKRELRDRLS
jgi:long-chain acyl-CoA synthetase